MKIPKSAITLLASQGETTLQVPHECIPLKKEKKIECPDE